MVKEITDPREKSRQIEEMFSCSVAQSIFLRSCVNGAEYYGDRLAANQWTWPVGTWFQTRLIAIRKERTDPIELSPAQVISLDERRGRLR